MGKCLGSKEVFLFLAFSHENKGAQRRVEAKKDIET
jgi:hypothetical protein